MILAIDTGNTHIVLGCINEKTGKISHILRLETNLKKTEYEYASDIKQILELEEVDRFGFDGAIISSSVPQIVDTLRKAVKIVTGITAMVVGLGVKTGLDIVLDDPSTIAADLVATAVAAKNLYPLPCIIIDMGTATTVTVVNAEGSYIGGAIMPGVKLSMRALADGTSLLPNIEIVPPKKTIASNTIDCMKSGIIYGSAGALDGILDHYIDELGGSVGSIVATGGLASTICPVCRHEITLDNNLLLKGLYVIYKKNHVKRAKK